MSTERRFGRFHCPRFTRAGILALSLVSLLALSGCGRSAAEIPARHSPAALAGQVASPASVPPGGTQLAESGRPLPLESHSEVRGVPVLMYHHLLPYAQLRQLPPNSDIVSTERFSAQMAYLAQNHYRTLTMAELAQVLAGREPPPPRAVVLTFDDGYQSNYVYALPVLRQLRLHATIFLVTGWVSDTPHPFDPGKLTYLSWPEVREMAQTGSFEFQSHSDSLHTLFGGRPRALGLKQADLAADLQRSADLIAQHTGQRPIALAYPFGVYNRALLDAAAQSGFRLGFLATGEAAVRPGDPALFLKRYFVAGWRGMRLFQRMVNGEQLWQLPPAPQIRPHRLHRLQSPRLGSLRNGEEPAVDIGLG